MRLEEAGAGIEPANRGFADPDLTTWLPRRDRERESRSGECVGVNVMDQVRVDQWSVGRCPHVERLRR